MYNVGSTYGSCIRLRVGLSLDYVHTTAPSGCGCSSSTIASASYDSSTCGSVWVSYRYVNGNVQTYTSSSGTVTVTVTFTAGTTAPSIVSTGGSTSWNVALYTGFTAPSSFTVATLCSEGCSSSYYTSNGQCEDGGPVHSIGLEPHPDLCALVDPCLRPARACHAGLRVFLLRARHGLYGLWHALRRGDRFVHVY